MLELVRFRSDEHGTFGALVIPGHGSLVTVERQWLDTDEDGKSWPYGIDRRSCVPAGVYDLVRDHSPKFGRAMWYLVGEGVVLRERAGNPQEWRSGCMFHGANKSTELMGCIAPGKIYHPIGSMISRSQTALGELMMALEQIARPQLHIRSA